jgi:hypothetical protein
MIFNFASREPQENVRPSARGSTFWQLPAAAASWGHVAAASIVAAAAPIEQAAEAATKATAAATVTMATAAATIATARRLAATGWGGGARGLNTAGRSSARRGRAARSGAAHVTTATAAPMTAMATPVASIPVATTIATTGIIAAASRRRVAAASSFAATPAAVAAAAQHAQQLKPARRGRDTQQTRHHHAVHKALHCKGSFWSKTQGDGNATTHVSPEPPAPRCSWQCAAAVTGTYSDSSAQLRAESRRAIVAIIRPASLPGRVHRNFAKLPGRLHKLCWQCQLNRPICGSPQPHASRSSASLLHPAEPATHESGLEGRHVVAPTVRSRVTRAQMPAMRPGRPARLTVPKPRNHNI